MKKILIVSLIAICLTFASGVTFIQADEDTAQKAPEMTKVSETVEQGSQSSSKVEELMKPDELIKSDEEMAPEIETLEESGKKIEDKMQ